MALVKICGITRIEDGLAAVAAGAHALGFMFYERSKRVVSRSVAAEIIAGLPREVRKVGVFVDASAEEVWETVEQTGIDTLQFHGDESPDYCGGFSGFTVWKAFRIASRESLSALKAYLLVDAWLLDSYVPGEMGGTGATFNWDLAVEAKRLGKSVILAGGLVPGNVAEAVRVVDPYAVDVSSGVESTPGIKDPLKMEAFVRALAGH